MVTNKVYIHKVFKMANSKMYCNYDCLTSNGVIQICSNEVHCSLCNIVFKSKIAYYNHTKNSGCKGKTPLTCFCTQPLQDHHCSFLEPCSCIACVTKFKSFESAVNHCQNAHKDGTWHNFSKFIILNDGQLANKELPEAQCKDCSSHWNFGQFEKWFKTGNSSTKRRLTRKVLTTSYHDCAIIELLSIRGKLVCWEKKPATVNLRIFNVNFPSGRKQVVLDFNQRDFRSIYSHIEHMIESCDRKWYQFSPSKSTETENRRFNNSMREMFTSWKQFGIPEAQGLFDFTVKHEINFQPFIDQITQMATTTFTGENLKKVLSLIAKIGICYSSNWNISVISLVVLDFLLSCNIPMDNAQDAVKLICASLPVLLTMFMPRSQSVDDYFSKEIVGAIGTIFSIFVGAMFLKGAPKASQIDDFVMSATKFGNLIRALDNSWKGLSKVIEFLYDYAYEYFVGYPKNISDARKYIEGVEEWFVECNNLCSNDVLERLQVDAPLCRRIERLYLQGLTISTRSATLKLDVGMRRSIENCQRNIAALNDKVSKSGAFCSGPKVEPLIIQLWGQSGVGKSGMMYLLSGDILKTEDLLAGGDGTVSDDWANQIYPRNVEQEFFDGYRNQLIVLYDDFGQLRDSQAKPNIEFMEMIRFGNLAPMCLHMAALEQKDKTYFSSKCVILSSNCREYAIESLISKEAFMRRIDISVEVRVKEAWRVVNSQKLNTEAVVAHFKSPLVPEVYEVRIWKDNQPSPIWIPFESLRTAICKEYAKKMNRHFELTSILSEYMKVPLAVDISKIKIELDKKIRVPPQKHYTLEELFIEAQGDTFYDAIEQNCAPNFPSEMKRIVLQNHGKWKNIKFNGEFVNEINYIGLIREYQFGKFNCKYSNFADALESALETVNGDWNLVLNFLSAHLSFLTLKTQLALSSSELKHVFANAETALDYFRGNNSFCNNNKCWHPDISNDVFGFQNGSEMDFISFSTLLCNHKFGFIYDDFCTFYFYQSTVFTKIMDKTTGQILKLKDLCSSWLSSVEQFFQNNATFLILGTYLGSVVSILAWCLYESHLDRKAERDGELKDAIEQFLSARDSYLRAKDRLISIEALTHEHEGLPVGIRIKHPHLCEECGMKFVHEHTIHDVETSKKIQPRHLCARCKTKQSELQSGDSVTTHKPVVRTEFQSGDNVTTHKPIIKTEFQSGDNVTTHRPVIKVEAFDEFLKGVMAEHNVDDDEFLQMKTSKQIHSSCPISAELATDPNAMTISRKVYANTYMISTRRNAGDVWQQHVNCVFVRGRTAITVAHLTKTLADRASGEIKIDGPFKPEGYILPISSLRFKELKYRDGNEKDMMILIFPSNVHDHQDIMSSLADSETMSKFNNVASMLITPTIIKDKAIFNQRFANVSAVDNEIEYLDKSSETGRRKMRQHYQYTMYTTNGDCGSFLVLMSNYLPKKIIGMHVAGDAAGRGYAIPINVDDIQEALRDIPLEAQIKLDLSRFETGEELSSTPVGDFTPALKSNLMVASPTKTALRRSKIYGEVLEPISAPAKLSRRVVLEDGSVIDPILKGLQKTGKIPPYMDPVLIKIACNDVLNLIQTGDTTRKRVLTNLESLTGVADDEFSNPLNRSSSPGYPWIKDRKGKGKTKWTSDPEGEYKMHVELEKAIEERESLALHNERYPTVWIDTLKDERRPLEKVAIGKTRVFAAGPMDFVVAFRKYFLGFCAHIADKRIDNEIAVGINPYSFDWTHLARHLQKRGNRVVAGDFGNFDGTLILQILEAIGEVINQWYDDGEDNMQIRRILWKELINSVHIEGNNIYLWSHGHPSGHPLTAVLNSLYNSVVCRIVFMLCAKDVGKIVTMKDFRDNVSMISYGDDNVLNISADCTDWFNQHTMSTVFERIGMEYTDELKNSNEDALPYRHLHDVSFLKRKFRWDPERLLYTAPLNFGVCMEMVNWIRGEIDVEEACSVNCQTSAMELSLHGKEVFEESVGKIRRACLKKMIAQPQILTYEEYVLRFEESYGMNM